MFRWQWRNFSSTCCCTLRGVRHLLLLIYLWMIVFWQYDDVYMNRLYSIRNVWYTQLRGILVTVVDLDTRWKEKYILYRYTMVHEVHFVITNRYMYCTGQKSMLRKTINGQNPGWRKSMLIHVVFLWSTCNYGKFKIKCLMFTERNIFPLCNANI